MADFKALQAPFKPQEVEWRIGRSGVKKNGDVWAVCLAYVTNRAIQQRLDDVLSPDCWENRFEPGPNGGVICGISIRVESEWDVEVGDWWVTKWDGADARDFEPVKSALSDSMKRAACQWGIGRYLYDLDEGWAEIFDSRTNGARRAKVKGPGGDKWFWWLPPKLPSWALPDISSQDTGTPAHQETHPVAEEESSVVVANSLNGILMSIGCKDKDDADAVVAWIWEGVHVSIDKVRNDDDLAGATVKMIQDKVDGGLAVSEVLETAHSIEAI